MGAHPVRLLDTGELPPVLDVRVAVLDEDRRTALATALALSAGVVSDVRTGQVA
jgi:hypothetical protein